MIWGPSLNVTKLLVCSIVWSSCCFSQDADETEAGRLATCGTLLGWHTDVGEAKRVAKRLGKPLVVLHLSGDFQNEDFT